MCSTLFQLLMGFLTTDEDDDDNDGPWLNRNQWDVQTFTQSSFGYRQQLDWFLIRRQSRCFLQSSQDFRVLQKTPFTLIQNSNRGTETQSQNIKPTLVFSSDQKPVRCTNLPTHLISTVQWRPLSLVAETGRGSAPQQQLHQYLMSTTRRLMKSRVPLEVSYIHQCITLHTYTHPCMSIFVRTFIDHSP